MKVVFADEAKADLRVIHSYIAYDNMRAAARVIDQIVNAAEMLADHPKIGTIYQDKIRRLAIPRFPYCIYYRVDETAETVLVVTILHTSRIPPDFG